MAALWDRSFRSDPRALALAGRHYSRQKPWTRQFVPPGRCFVLYAKGPLGEAVWVTSWPYARYVKHQWPGAWVCSFFRNEGAALSSVLIAEAVAATRGHFGEVPELGMITFIDPSAVRSTNPGCCFLKAGFRRAGHAKDGKLCLQLTPEDMPPAFTIWGNFLPEPSGLHSAHSLSLEPTHGRSLRH